MKIAIHSNAAWGGIVDYMIWQANAFSKLGHEVFLIVPENFDKTADDGIEIIRTLPNLEKTDRGPKWKRRLQWILGTLRSWKFTTREVENLEVDALLLSSYVEYLSPLWKREFTRLRRKLPALRIGAVVHDPVRKAFGPEGFHRYSVRCGYEILDACFVHNPVELNQEGACPPVPTHQIPFGIYNFPEATSNREETLKRLGIPENASVLLAFGHVRDGKNLDLAVKMLAKFPDLHLVIAGKVMSGQDRPVSFYESLARDENVSDRVTILNRFIPDDEAADLFASSNFVLLSYDREFVSASSVLHVALKFRKLALATSGDGHLKWAIEKYNLGIWTQPDSLDALSKGMAELIDPNSHFQPRWSEYELENTWEENAERILSVLQTDPVGSLKR